MGHMQQQKQQKERSTTVQTADITAAEIVGVAAQEWRGGRLVPSFGKTMFFVRLANARTLQGTGVELAHRIHGGRKGVLKWVNAARRKQGLPIFE
ncbi:TPA: hypothetical protein DEB00_03550 [Candidatus Uhrbacteria bacterium]|nr:hypothetical protein [Candidatus Uhrbacteria bacterium]